MDNNKQMTEADIIKKNEVDLTEILSVLWRGKWLIILITAVFAVSSVFFALSLPNTYKATVLLSPVEDTQGGMLSSLKSEFGGLAAMAGVNLGGGKGDKSALALQVMQSRSFLNNFVEKYELKPKLMATEGWDLGSNQLIYNAKVYDKEAGIWLRDVAAPFKPEPGIQEVFEHIRAQNLAVIEEKEKGLITIAMTHYSPYLAKEMVENIVVEINDYMKAEAVAESNVKIEYLKKALAETSVADMQKIFYQLIEQQEQTKMLAQTQSQYVFKTIDPAILPIQKAGPKRALICLGITFLGSVLAFVLLLFRHFVLRK
ncbi:Wzz/FepE/Etk N-terminal domain-containing protein [Pseudoalteromonas piscicida]|uniref:Wzz/FepE/Etk N-terminal domain-containing protein n=1 Tax=Pseudoalteromonas piscicida TaxID=43662 RepID=UPI0005F9CD95|nr:Wzz/FepE/Etk N-terminal domain-containing protein [Pseudoalteromonas piscicida]KJZ04686.1 lipopolysaccharide biosynthesis protein [Pseudoalteromonas piscicida]